MNYLDSSLNLPIQQVLNDVAAGLSAGARLVLCAAPGAGKTTLVPNYLLDHVVPAGEEVWLVQPRRLAARSTARRIAQLRDEPLGTTVGYQVRFDNKTSAQTRIVVMTEGILLQRLQHDAGLERVGCVILDEFHERNIDGDLLLGMLLRVQETLRPELRIVIMSATLDHQRLIEHLDPCSWVDCPGRQFPVEVSYVRHFEQEPIEARVCRHLERVVKAGTGHTLIFLPGAPEIHRTHQAIQQLPFARSFSLHKLFGDMPGDEQDAVLEPSERRKIILATNIAETSITIDGVDAVIDSGLAKIPMMNHFVGLTKLETSEISRAEADQRAGRAGRTGPGVCLRLWPESLQAGREPFRLPEVLRCDLSGPVLRLLNWGERDLTAFPWVTHPTPAALDQALQTLTMLQAVHQGDVTRLGRQMSRLPVEPRLARLLIAGHELGVLDRAALLAAMLSERDPLRARSNSPPPRLGRSSTGGPRGQRGDRQRSLTDVADRVAVLEDFARGQLDGATQIHAAGAENVLRVADHLARSASDTLGKSRDSGLLDAPGSVGDTDEDRDQGLYRAVFTAFADRLAVRRERGRPRGLMVGGRGVRLEGELSERDAPMFVCVEVHNEVPDARVTMAAPVHPEWIPNDLVQEQEELFFHPSQKQVMARRRTYYRDLMLAETPVAISDWDQAARLLSDEAGRCLDQVLPDDESTLKLIRRVQWLGAVVPELQLPAWDEPQIRELLPQLAAGCRSFAELRSADWKSRLMNGLTSDQQSALQREAPERIGLPEGRSVALEYELGKPPILAARIQDLFGLKSTPTLARGRVRMLVHLLGPNMRVQQITDDLASFWANTYPVVRKELRRRYPKHAWPENPLDSNRSD
ncbi:MAG: ATP-dependent helicase C-terminal domain-containing protein [Pirellulales bacterium]